MKDLPAFDALVLEGGSLRCAFTAGVLDAFAAVDYKPFQSYYAVSAGSMAMISFLSGQRKHFIELSERLVEDGKFISFRSAFSDEGLMNLSHLARVVKDSSPIDWDAANAFIKDKQVHVVTTDFETGEAHYLQPQKENWIKSVLASATLPFVTRGKVMVRNRWMFDGGYADAIPLDEAIARGCQNILVIRTRPAGVKVEQDTLDFIASYLHRDNRAIAQLFDTWHIRYNQVAEKLTSRGKGAQKWEQLAPKHELRSDGYRITKMDLRADYRHGLEVALDWMATQSTSSRRP
jgi:predicted patatin/cPLA2 family phospholipase